MGENQPTELTLWKSMSHISARPPAVLHEHPLPFRRRPRTPSHMRPPSGSGGPALPHPLASGLAHRPAYGG